MAHRDDGGFRRRHRSAHHHLELHDELASHHDRVFTCLRSCAVATNTAHYYVDRGRARQCRPDTIDTLLAAKFASCKAIARSARRAPWYRWSASMAFAPSMVSSLGCPISIGPMPLTLQRSHVARHATSRDVAIVPAGVRQRPARQGSWIAFAGILQARVLGYGQGIEAVRNPAVVQLRSSDSHHAVGLRPIDTCPSARSRCTRPCAAPLQTGPTSAPRGATAQPYGCPCGVVSRLGSCLSTRAGTSCAIAVDVNPVATAAVIPHAAIHRQLLMFSPIVVGIDVIELYMVCRQNSTYRELLLAVHHWFLRLRLWRSAARWPSCTPSSRQRLPRWQYPRLAAAHAARALRKSSGEITPALAADSPPPSRQRQNQSCQQFIEWQVRRACPNLRESAPIAFISSARCASSSST